MNATTVEKFQMNSTEFVDNAQNSTQSVDEVDFVRSVSNPALKTHSIPRDGNNKAKLAIISTHQCPLLAKKLAPGTLYGDCEVKTSIKSSLSTLEKFSIFNLHKKKNEVTAGHTVKDRHKFVKSASIARLLGNSYNTKKSESDMKIANDAAIANGSPISGARRFGGTERFQKCSNLEDALSEVCLQDFREDKDLSTKAFRTISRSLGKLWWKRSHSVDISIPDPEFKVSYLGNVLTGWAKGEGCVEKPLNTLWRNYTQNHKPDVIMRVKVCASGLKATTRQHGLTEYWANRITHCCSPKNYPRVFCWIYRHEGRKLKHELRCHAVLCSKESIAQEICKTLRDNLDRALRDFKREKLSKQNARLSLANSVYENPSLPRRKILLSVGGNNYRPPLERSKSAPKLMAIEEAIGEEDGEEIEETNEPEMQPCCQKDSLYPAMTLGRRRCRRGHSIRRTGKGFIKPNPNTNPFEENATKECTEDIKEGHDEKNETTKATDERAKTKSESSLTSEEDDLDKLLCYNDYDTNSPLAGELLSYFDMKMKPKTLSLTDLNDDTLVFEPTLTTNPKPRPLSSLSLDHLDNCSGDDDDYDDLDEANEVFYQQSTILNLLQRGSLRKVANLSISSSDDSNSIESSKPTPPSVLALAQQQHLDSDEGSISSGCETASTVTANMDDTSLKYTPQNNNQSQPNTPEEDRIPRTPDSSNHQNSELNNNGDKKFSTCSIQFKIPRSPGVLRRTKGKALSIKEEVDISDSEFSDESGYVEFQEQNSIQNKKSVSV